MDQTTITLTIVGMALVTYLPRLLPVWFLSSRSLPPLVIAWLRHIPIAVLSAMLLPSLIVRDARIDLGLDNLFFWVALPTLLVAWKTRSFFGTVIVGMALVAAARYLSA
jgi:branched-subunit amino acid transport protein